MSALEFQGRPRSTRILSGRAETATRNDAGPTAPAWQVLSDTAAKPNANDPVLSQIARSLGLRRDELVQASKAARANGTHIARELVFEGTSEEAAMGEAMADHLGLPFECPGEGDRIIAASGPETGPFASSVRTCDAFLKTKVFIAPTLERLGQFRDHLVRNPTLRQRYRVTTETAIKRLKAAQSQSARFEAATLSLSAKKLDQSARIVATGWQGAVLGVLCVVVPMVAYHHLMETLLAFHLSAAIVFALWICLRFAAATGRHEPQITLTDQEDPSFLPVYTIVVALHREADVVGHLIANLEALNWPKSKLEIYLVCEADDPDTIAPCTALTRSKPQFHVIAVPAGNPRTKPKALNHVLPLACGEFLVLYDAEDEPHPDQLREAYTRYRAGNEKLGCLQAPLSIRNAGRNWLTAMFAMEYAALFRAFLPFLSRHRLPIPLGGTSNHFRVSALRDVGAWDSHNVTEDADLGMRLKRYGYDIATISLPTREDAPEITDVWIKQRTRWLKGWLQTYAVHMRNPLRLYRELGLWRFIVFQLVFHGMVSAALLLPYAVISLTITMLHILTVVGWGLTMASNLLILDLAILAGGFLSFVALAFRAALRDNLVDSLAWLPTVPIYWGLVSFAAYRALCQLFINPHAWEKTPHGLASRADKRDPRYRIEPIFDVTNKL